MSFTSVPIFDAMKAKLGYLSARQGVLAQNVANADTPDYKAKDLRTPDFRRTLSKELAHVPMETTNKKHLTGSSSGHSKFRIVNRESTYELNPTGNNVSIEEEMSKVASNYMEYQKTINLYRKSVELFKIAIGKSNG
ncbi:MAG: flagellar basal body rod protein FlgB [Rickettsiales bacterium]